jgi:hypothetical protein
MAQRKQKPKKLRLYRPKVNLGPRVYRIQLKSDPKKWIRVKILNSGTGLVTSNLHDNSVLRDPRSQLDKAVWNLQVDVVESMMLSLGCAGVDLDSPEFQQGFNVSMDSIANYAS